MENKRLFEKNICKDRIKELSRCITRDEEVVERLQSLQKNKEYNEEQIRRITETNNERKEEIDELEDRIISIDSGLLDFDIQQEYLKNQREIGKRNLDVKQKQKDISMFEKENKMKFDKIVKDSKKSDREHRYSSKDHDRGMYHLERATDTLPNYIKNNLNEMPSNKGYIWKNVWFFGNKDPEINQPIVMFEKFQGYMKIIEIYRDNIFHYEKRDREGKVLMDVVARKIKL
jgi:chromosome segregation ATPase